VNAATRLGSTTWSARTVIATKPIATATKTSSESSVSGATARNASGASTSTM
jgi:hypothetical protein